MELISGFFNHTISLIITCLSSVLFLDVGGFPLIVLWLIVAAIFFTFYLRFVNIRLFGHAIDIAKGRYRDSMSKGEVSPLQALLSALSATVGLGSIAGIAVGVAVGGAGAIFWIVLAGFCGMATKFAEVTLSMRYRKIADDGKVFGGPFQYISGGMAELGYPQLGKILTLIFAVFCLGGAIGGGNMFQSNQAVTMIRHSVSPLADYGWLISLIFALLVYLVLAGSIRRIAKVADVIVPIKGIVYLICALIIIGGHYERIPSALSEIFTHAFTGEGAQGGLIGMIAIALKRASFANEAGLGSAPIAHATAQTSEPVRAGAIALLEPFFAALVALLTGLIIVISNAHIGATVDDGVMITSKAFETVAPWFSLLLTLNVCIFAYSTTIGWSYYGEIAWSYLFGRRAIKLYQLLFCCATFAGGIMHFGVVLDLSDLFILGMALPNLIVVYALRKTIRNELDTYVQKLKSGEFTKQRLPDAKC